MTKLTPPGKAAWSAGAYGPDGSVYVTSDQGSDFQRLGRLRSGKFTVLSREPKWDVDSFKVADDWQLFIAYVVNENGASRLAAARPAIGRACASRSCRRGDIGNLLRLRAVGATSASISTAPNRRSMRGRSMRRTLAATRWTASEAGGLDSSINVEPELITVKSFDGEPVSGFPVPA